MKRVWRASDPDGSARFALGTVFALGALVFVLPAWATAPGATTITSISPTAGAAAAAAGPGATVTITGTGFTGTTNVWFGVVLSSDRTAVVSSQGSDGFQVASDTTLYAHVPVNGRTGAIEVCSPTGCALGPVFTVNGRLGGMSSLPLEIETMTPVPWHIPTFSSGTSPTGGDILLCKKATKASRGHKATKAQVSTTAHPCQSTVGATTVPDDNVPVDPDTGAKGGADGTWVVRNLDPAGTYELLFQNTSGTRPIIAFTWAPPPGLTVTAVLGTAGGHCVLTADAISCTGNIAPSPCSCLPGGQLTVTFTATPGGTTTSSKGMSVTLGPAPPLCKKATKTTAPQVSTAAHPCRTA